MRKTVSVLVSLPREVHAAGRAEAVARDVSYSRLIASAVRREVGLPPPDRELQKSARRATRAAEAAAA